MRFIALLVLLAFAPALSAPKPSQPFQTIEGCAWKADRWNDGECFHVLTGDASREIVVRLYFVDTPEAEPTYRDRLDEQAAYFGITREQAVIIAHEAAQFTRMALAVPFTIHTRWRPALGRSVLGRVYAFVLIGGEQDLNEALVAAGLARIYGTRTTLPSGRDSREYLAQLAKVEAKAKRERRWAWRFAR